MRGPGPTPRSSRARVRGATIAAFVALAPLLPAAAVAVGTLKVDASLPYVCTLPSGQQPATVRITAAFPERAVPGEEIRPTDVTTTVELPAAAVADLTALKASTVRAETLLTVGAGQNGQRTEASWRGTAQPLGVPAEGPLTLTTSGDVPTLTTDAAGDLTLTAEGLAVDLAPSTADGAPTTPASLSVSCVPGQNAGDRTLLATVPVGSGTPSPEPSGPPSSSATPESPSPGPHVPRPPLPTGLNAPPRTGTTRGTGEVPTVPGSGARKDRGLTAADEPGAPAARPAAPPCVTEKPTPTSLSAYITGYSNVRKLNGANVIPVSCVLIEQGQPEFVVLPDGSMHLFQTSTGALSHGGRRQTPPFKATFLTFGFAPTTATLVLEQAGPMTVTSDVLLVFPDNLAETYIRVPLVLRVLDVEVNGTRLDVGPSCRTEKPLSSPEPTPAKYPGDHLVLLGKGQLLNGTDATGYLLTSGGPLTGEVTIPAFKGCGAGGENLDRLLTASISGPGNHIKQIQGQTCSVGVETPPPDQCTEDRQPLVVPKPAR
ncbi:hypothetical protein GCM10010222_15440 [Streptomyces tanashiensis]|nr:DUF6801 domain-containing protein [Streptomyces tanashiensis]GGS75276.1 hypothetical protein GCM10010222_15440 [Streptomyces tanashiensis]